MKRKLRKLSKIFVSLTLLISTAAPVWAMDLYYDTVAVIEESISSNDQTGINEVQSESAIKTESTFFMSEGAVKSVYIPDVDAKGEKFSNEQIANQSRSSSDSIVDDIVILEAAYENEMILINGFANGTEFSVTGKFCAISENGNVVAFKAEDTLGNFRVIYCSIERDISESSKYFNVFSLENPVYDCFTKLYLDPTNNDNTNQQSMSEKDIIAVELFHNFFPSISEQTIANLPANSHLELYWYAREFEPVVIRTVEEGLSPVLETTISYDRSQSKLDAINTRYAVSWGVGSYKDARSSGTVTNEKEMTGTINVR